MGYLSDLLALVTSVVRDSPRPSVSEGISVTGSWNPKESTIQHIYGDTGAILGDEDDDQPLVIDGFKLLTTQPGDQYAPRGEEDTIAVPVPSGMVVGFVHSAVNSPQVPNPGERWVFHYNANGQVDSFWKHTNDGHTTGDGLGGAHYGGNANQTQFTTKTGHTVIADDTAKTVKVISAGGHVVTCDDNSATKGITVTTAGGLQHHLDDTVQKITHTAGSVTHILDGAGSVISQVATTVNLGASSGLTSLNKAVRQTDIQTLANNVVSQSLQALSGAIGAAAVTAAIPNAAAFTAILSAAGFATGIGGINPTIPGCSSNVFIK